MNNIEDMVKGDTEIDIQMLSVDEISSSQDSSVTSRYFTTSSITSHSNSDSNYEVIPSFKDITKYPFPVRQDSAPLTEVLEIDLKTKDNHVPRDQDLLRLTGSHPFNCEPPLSTLYNSGFLTPAQLHFVRNHGPVPQVLDQDILNWEISIEGMVSEPYKIKLSEIISEFEIFTVPITLVCAGNRRKEQNLVKKGTGFNWGAAGTSTNLWTGPLLMDLIERAKPFKKARHVWMEGCDDPANGAYGTSIMLNYIRDYERSIMLAYKQNGEFLTPDHGRPLRVIIPGVIGGRSVKWLKRLVISDVPSDNWYHYYDNKVLPTMVEPEEAKANDHWWKDERYTLYDLNIQSITCRPEHEEVLDMSTYSNPEKDEYTLGGFAYNGGGIRVGRVEISLDKGKTWKLTEIDYPEDRYREAGYFRLFGGLVNVCDRMSCLCWCFWKLKVKVSELINAKDILVRAMDVRMVVQPRNMYWNVTSMLNNWWYRVAIVKLEDGNYKFEHPVHATKSGGWMDRVKSEGGDILDNNWGEYDADLAAGSQQRELKPVVDEDIEMMCDPEKMNVIITKEELAKHENNDENPWFVVKGHVFDGTEYLDDHPGGAQSITMVSGEDATEDFIAIHSSFAKKMLPKWHLGKLEVEGEASKVATIVEEDYSSRATLLDPKKWHKIKLFEKEVISHDTRIFKFELQHPDQTTGLAVGKHLFIRLMDKKTNKYVMRAYTPKSCHRTKGRLEILIKVYFPDGDFKGGAMTTLIEDLPIGGYIETKGPIGEFEYQGNGQCLINDKHQFKLDKFVMIAGGSGITPCYQVLKEVLRSDRGPDESKDETQLDFFFGNRTEEDILCREELDRLCQENDNFKLDYCLSDLSKLPPNWTGLTGRLTFKMIDDYMDGCMDNGKAMLLVCGPPGMNKVVEDWVIERNFNKDYVIYF